MGERKQMTGDVSRRKTMSDDDIKKSKKDLTHNGTGGRSRFKIQDSRFKIQDSRFNAQPDLRKSIAAKRHKRRKRSRAEIEHSTFNAQHPTADIQPGTPCEGTRPTKKG
jgi:hypothetical protein